jgi:hypothetical protein
MRDDAICTTAVERNGTIKHIKQLRVILGDVLSTNATTLLALREDVVADNTLVHHVHEHGNTSTIVSTEARVRRSVPLVSLLVLDLAYWVLTLDTMHSIYVRHEQRAMVVIGTRINVQVTAGINERHLLQVLRHSSSKPLRERIDTKASVWTLNRQGAL